MIDRWKHIVDCFIVRIYRRADAGGESVAGLVEKVGKAGKKTFKNKEELWQLLQPQRRKKRR